MWVPTVLTVLSSDHRQNKQLCVRAGGVAQVVERLPNTHCVRVDCRVHGLHVQSKHNSRM
jgi:hypothetical protein